MSRTHVTPADFRRLRHFHTPSDPPLDAPYHLDRTSDILDRTLPAMLETFILACPHSKITLVRDVSEAHASHLDALTKSLQTTKKRQAEFVHAWGEEGLREETFFTTWEAALFRAGILVRYEVVIE
jgi:hypothetical protein